MTYEVHHIEDSFAALRELPEGAVDCIITDPPYSEHVHQNMCSGTALKKQIAEGGHGVPRVELPFDPLSSHAFAADMVRVARRWVLAFCAVEDFGLYRAAVSPACWVRAGIWYKPNSMGQLSKDRPAAAYEGLAIMHRANLKKAWNGKGSYAYWESPFPDEETHFVCNGTRGEEDRHPNQKPLKLCLELVAKFSNRGDTVLDPFAGSGRIGEACIILGRKYIGLERDPVWVDRARERLRAAEETIDARLEDHLCMRLCAAPKRVA